MANIFNILSNQLNIDFIILFVVSFYSIHLNINLSAKTWLLGDPVQTYTEFNSEVPSLHIARSHLFTKSGYLGIENTGVYSSPL